MAHELRNPLAPIVNYLEIMSLQGVHDSKFKEAAVGIDQQIKSITHLLRDLLDVSRISQGKILLKKECVDARSIIEKAIETTQTLIREKKHELIVQISEVPIFVVADPLRIEQVLVNLLSNAAKYMEPGGKIWITCKAEDQRVLITVRDIGFGISKECLLTIFDKFSQVESSISHSLGGLGMGLYISKTLAEMHGGSVVAKSEGIDKGSEFLLQLPICDPEVDQVQVFNKVTSPPTAITQDPKKVLVVDDNQFAADTLVRLLQELGHEAHALYFAKDVLEYLEEHYVEILFLDIGMPEMNGNDLAHLLRERGYTDLKIVALTGYGRKEDKKKSFRAGFSKHLVKPVEIEQLRGVLRDK